MNLALHGESTARFAYGAATRALGGDWSAFILPGEAQVDDTPGGPGPTTAQKLFERLRSRLLQYARPGLRHPVLTSSQNDIFSLMKMFSPEDALAGPAHQALLEVPNHGRRLVILGGGIPKKTNFDRDKDVPHFVRADGAWFEFRFIVEERGDGAPVRVLGYGCEIRFPDRVPPWIRLDLNLPGHDNAEAGLRSHLHPGTEDWALPAPLFAPDEALDMLVWHTRVTRKPRAGG